MKHYEYNREDIYSWSSDSEELDSLVGRLGYFGQSEYQIQCAIENDIVHMVDTVDTFLDTKSDGVFYVEKTDQYYGLFLPLKKEKNLDRITRRRVRPSNSFRPFKGLDEVKRVGLTIGTIVKYRPKERLDEFVRTNANECMITGYVWNELSQDWCIEIGGSLISLHNLFVSYEYLNGDTWRPFGVEE